MKKIVSFALLLALVTISFSSCFLSDQEKLKRQYFDTGIALRATGELMNGLIDSLKEEGKIKDQDILRSENEQMRQEDHPDPYQNHYWMSHSSCLLKIKGTEIAVNVIFQPKAVGRSLEERHLFSFSLCVRTKETNSLEEIECVPDSIKDTLDSILSYFSSKGDLSSDFINPVITTDILKSYWNREYLIDRFDETAYVTYANDDLTEIRYESNNKRDLSSYWATMNCTVYREITAEKSVYYMEYTISSSYQINL